MTLEPYREVLALPGVRPLILLAVLARVPVTAVGVTLTLHVVLDLDRGYGAAGLVGAAATVGTALGAPLLGRLVDSRGLRLVLGITTVAEAVFWGVAPVLPYPALLAAVIDASAPVWGFAVAGAAGAALTLTALPAYRTAHRVSRPPATSMVTPVSQEEAPEARNRVV